MARSDTTRNTAVSRPDGLEEQQALVLEHLERAEGAPVSFAELREAGIELPASIVGELELSGWPIDHCRAPEPDGGIGSGVRLDPVLAARFGTDSESEASSYRVYHTRPWAGLGGALAGGLELRGGRPPGDRRHGRPPGDQRGGRPARSEPLRRRRGWIRPLALLAGAALVAVLVITGVSSGTGRRVQTISRTRAGTTRRSHHRSSPHAPRTAARRKRTHPVASAVTSRPLTAQPASTPTTTSTPTGSTATTASTTPAPQGAAPSLTSAIALDARGHYLLESGQYAAAIPLLRDAMQDTGMSSGACLQPASQACLTYAYALYDMATALLREGDPSAAVPLLEQRLQIDNQRPVVASELTLARRQAQQRAGGGGQTGTDTGPSPNTTGSPAAPARH